MVSKSHFFLPPINSLKVTIAVPGVIEFVLEHLDGVLDGLHLADQTLQRQIMGQLHVGPARPTKTYISSVTFRCLSLNSPAKYNIVKISKLPIFQPGLCQLEGTLLGLDGGLQVQYGPLLLLNLVPRLNKDSASKYWRS